MAEVRRQAAADTVVRLASARLWPNVPVGDIARAAGITHAELVDAVRRHLRQQHLRQPRPSARPPSEPRIARGAPGPAPPGQKWCSGGVNHAGHFAVREDFGRNRTRPDGLSNLCREHWRLYWDERARAKHEAELARLEAERERRRRRNGNR